MADSAIHAAAITVAAFAAIALGSAIQIAFYLRGFGATHRTDGFIAAFAVYSLVVVFAQLLRTTAVPLLSGRAPVLDGAAFAWAIVLIAVVAAGAFEALAAPLGALVARNSGAAGRHIAAVSLRIMAPAMALQIVGAGLAVVGGVRERLVPVGIAYMVYAATGLIAFFVLQGAAREIVLPWTTLVASVALVIGLLAGVRIRYHRPPTPERILIGARALLASTPLPLCFILMYPITLALAPAGRAGQITLFGLAFTACAYLAGFTGQALSMSEVVALSRIDPSEREVRRAFVTRAFRSSLLLAAPLLGIAAVAGAPIVHALVPQRTGGPKGYFAIAVLLLIPWLVAMLAFWAMLPVWLTHDRRLNGARLGAVVVGLLALHIAATLAFRAVAGFDGVILAMAVAPAAFDAASIGIAVPEAGWPFLRHAAAVLAVGGASFGVLYLGAMAVAHPGAVTGGAAALVGALAYAGLAALAYPDAARTVIHLASRR